MASVISLLLFAVCVYFSYVEAHVSLTFPPARKFDLDFLDNSRTKGPCGMPKGKEIIKLTKDLRQKYMIIYFMLNYINPAVFNLWGAPSQGAIHLIPEYYF